jgi:hypothetical protein
MKTREEIEAEVAALEAITQNPEADLHDQAEAGAAVQALLWALGDRTEAQSELLAEA